ncbi:MAG TPA: thermonuclease family protein, partial [Desulfomonilaceae bacterium]|nr:thermonuclease family protein [Desulfomonilaceae bacterium]
MAPVHRRFRLLIFLLFAIVVPTTCLAWQARVMEVPYGDHLKVRADGKTETIRLYGIDSPIDPQPFGREARLYTSKRVLGKVVEITPIIRDHYDRIVAWVEVDGESLNKELIRKGMTWWYRKYLPFETELGQLEEEARKAKVGLWKDSSPIPPWEYQPVPPAEPAGPLTTQSHGRRGSVRERVMSGTGPSKPVVG